jgi:hypothetical protein
MSTLAEIARRKAELETLELRAAAIKNEIAELDKADEIVVYRRKYWDAQTPQRQNEIVRQVNAGSARLID